MWYSLVSFSSLGIMDTTVTMDQPNAVENISQKIVKKVEEKFVVVVEAEENLSEVSPSSKVAPIGPITPDSNKETGDFLFCFTSPLTLVSSPRNDNLHASVDFSPCTPVEGGFDPFAPGPEELAMAPHCKKYLKESRVNVARRLKFDSSVNFVLDGNHKSDVETISDDEMILETVYDTLLEAIVSKQTEGLVTEILPLDRGFDGFKTPDSATRLSGIAETCPGAPLKTTGTTRKLRNVDQSLCRKLEF